MAFNLRLNGILYADVIIEINTESLENTRLCRFNPIFYVRVLGKFQLNGGLTKSRGDSKRSLRLFLCG